MWPRGISAVITESLGQRTVCDAVVVLDSSHRLAQDLHRLRGCAACTRASRRCRTSSGVDLLAPPSGEEHRAQRHRNPATLSSAARSFSLGPDPGGPHAPSTRSGPIPRSRRPPGRVRSAAHSLPWGSREAHLVPRPHSRLGRRGWNDGRAPRLSPAPCPRSVRHALSAAVPAGSP